jgi:hypothetical protein
LVALTLGFLCIAPRTVEAATARVRWLPSSSASAVTGYRVYARNSGSPYGTAVWTGNPAPATDGAISTTVTYTPASSGVNYFTVVAVGGTSGGESGLASELPVGTPNACRVDSCTTKTSCTFAQRPDGSPCPDATFCNGDEVCQAGNCAPAAARDCSDPIDCTIDSCDETNDRCVHTAPAGCCVACDAADPCLADACAQGDCSAPPGEDIVVNRVRLMKKASGIKLAAKGSFISDAMDPSVTGVEIAFLAPDGTEVYSAIIPSYLIKPGSSPGRFRFSTTRAQSDPMENGIDKLDFRLKAGVWSVTLKGDTSTLEDAFSETSLTWMMRMGNSCARGLYMECNQTSSKSVCR